MIIGHFSALFFADALWLIAFSWTLDKPIWKEVASVMFTLLYFAATFSGYWFGQKGKSLVSVVNGKMLATKPKKKEQDEIKK